MTDQTQSGLIDKIKTDKKLLGVSLAAVGLLGVGLIGLLSESMTKPIQPNIPASAPQLATTNLKPALATSSAPQPITQPAAVPGISPDMQPANTYQPPAYPLGTDMEEGFKLVFSAGEGNLSELGFKVKKAASIGFNSTIPADLAQGLDLKTKPVQVEGMAYIKIDQAGATTFAGEVSRTAGFGEIASVLRIDGVEIAQTKTARWGTGASASLLATANLAPGWHKLSISLHAERGSTTDDITPTGSVALKIKLPGGQMQDLSGSLLKTVTQLK